MSWELGVRELLLTVIPDPNRHSREIGNPESYSTTNLDSLR